MADYYVRTKSGTFRDDRHEFTTKWKGAAAGDLKRRHFDNPNLEIVTAEEHTRQSRKAAKEDGGDSR